jgi:hypothetical protein
MINMSETATQEKINPAKLICGVTDIDVAKTALMRAWGGLDACKQAEAGCSKRRSFNEAKDAMNDIIDLLRDK